MDASSLIVVLGLAVLVLGLSLMRTGSRGAQSEEPDDGNDDHAHPR